MFWHSENRNDLSALPKDKMADANFRIDSVFQLSSVSPPPLVGSFQHLGVVTHKMLLKHNYAWWPFCTITAEKCQKNSILE